MFFLAKMGYSRKNPHLPDGWHAGNSRGRGGRLLWKSRWEGRLDLKLLFGGHFKKCNLSFQIFALTEETFSESKKVVVFQSMHFLPFRFSFKDSAKNIIKVIKGENTRKARG